MERMNKNEIINEIEKYRNGWLDQNEPGQINHVVERLLHIVAYSDYGLDGVIKARGITTKGLAIEDFKRKLNLAIDKHKAQYFEVYTDAITDIIESGQSYALHKGYDVMTFSRNFLPFDDDDVLGVMDAMELKLNM